MQQNTLHNRKVKGAAWSFADNILIRGVSFIVGIVLARLLTPDEYGLIGIITILNYSIKEQVKDIFHSFLISLFVGALLYFIGRIHINHFECLVIQVFVGLSVSYFLLFFKLFEFKEIQELSMSVIKKLKK